MATTRDLPPVSDGKFLDRVREELQRLMGSRGGDRALRVSDSGGLVGGFSTTIVGTGGGSGATAEEPDLTPPPNVSSLEAIGGITQVIVTWAGIGYPQGHGNKQTLIYAVKKEPSDTTMPTAGDAHLVAVAPHALTLIALPSEPNTRWHIWAKFESVDGVLSAAFAGGTNGIQATTGQDVTHLMEVMTGQIRQSHLYSTLGSRIDLIDAEETVSGSVAARVKQERDARIGDVNSAVSLANTYTGIYAYQKANGEQVALDLLDLTAVVVSPDTGLSATRSKLINDYATIASLTSSLASVTTSLQAFAGDAANTAQSNAQNHAVSYAYAKTDGDAMAGIVSTLGSTVNNSTTGVVANASALDTVKTLVNDGDSGVTATASRVSVLQSQMEGSAVSGLRSAIETEAFTRGTADSAQASNITTLQSQVAGAQGSGLLSQLQTEAETRANVDGHLSAQYSVRVSLTEAGRTVVGGFGLSGASGGTAGPTIDFGVRADTFFVEAPSGGSNPTGRLAPFIIRTGTFTEGGVSVPAGVYMDAAYIVNLTAMYARIGSLVADDIAAASINVSQLVAGSMAVGAYAQSTGFVSGTSGWRISGNGVAEFSGVVVRGTIFATAGAIGGNAIDATGIQSPGYTPGSNGWRLDTTGLVRAFASSGSRVLDMAATGTQPILKIGGAMEILANGSANYGGNLSAAGGTFSGILTAAAISAVQTINIAENAVTIPLTYESTNVFFGENGATHHILTYDFTMPSAGKLIVLWQADAGSDGGNTMSIEVKVNGVVSGTFRTGTGSMDDTPISIGFQSCNAGPNQVRVYWSGSSGQTIYKQKLIIIGAQR